jgi:hypothetical protein
MPLQTSRPARRPMICRLPMQSKWAQSIAESCIVAGRHASWADGGERSTDPFCSVMMEKIITLLKNCVETLFFRVVARGV